MARTGWHEFALEGFTILVGRGAQDNDRLTFEEADPQDSWLHADGYAGSHVVVRNPDRVEVPRSVLQAAAQLAAFHSKAREAGGKVAVHCCRVSEVSKKPGMPAGKVLVRGGTVLKVYPRDPFA